MLFKDHSSCCDQLGNHFSNSRDEVWLIECRLRKLDNLRDILQLNLRRLGSNWYQHEKILGKLLISDLSSWVEESVIWWDNQKTRIIIQEEGASKGIKTRIRKYLLSAYCNSKYLTGPAQFLNALNVLTCLS